MSENFEERDVVRILLSDNPKGVAEVRTILKTLFHSGHLTGKTYKDLEAWFELEDLEETVG